MQLGMKTLQSLQSNDISVIFRSLSQISGLTIKWRTQPVAKFQTYESNMGAYFFKTGLLHYRTIVTVTYRVI